MNEDIKPGRRFIFDNIDELKQKIKTYFDLQDPHTENQLKYTGDDKHGEPMFQPKQVMTKQKPYTVTGLARSLGVARSTLQNYRNINHYPDDIDEQFRQELMATIENAYWQIEEYNEQNLHKSGLANGVKFNLVNNFNWQDKHVVDQTNREATAALDEVDDTPVQDGRDEVAAAAQESLNPPAGDTPPPTEPVPPVPAEPVNPPEPTNDPGSPPQE